MREAEAMLAPAHRPLRLRPGRGDVGRGHRPPPRRPHGRQRGERHGRCLRRPDRRLALAGARRGPAHPARRPAAGRRGVPSGGGGRHRVGHPGAAARPRPGRRHRPGPARRRRRASRAWPSSAARPADGAPRSSPPPSCGAAWGPSEADRLRSGAVAAPGPAFASSDRSDGGTPLRASPLPPAATNDGGRGLRARVRPSAPSLSPPEANGSHARRINAPVPPSPAGPRPRLS